MKVILSKLKRYFRQFTGLFPSKLPTGMQEFDVWAESLADTYFLATPDMDSIKYNLAALIMHFGPTVNRKPKYYFAKALNAGASKQVAGAQFHEIKSRHQAAQQAAAAKQSEATLSVVASDASKK